MVEVLVPQADMAFPTSESPELRVERASLALESEFWVCFPAVVILPAEGPATSTGRAELADAQHQQGAARPGRHYWEASDFDAAWRLAR